MDVRLVSLSSLMFLTAWITPGHSTTTEFRNTFRSLSISLNKKSPAYAALESIHTVVRAGPTVQSDPAAQSSLTAKPISASAVTNQVQFQTLSLSTKKNVTIARPVQFAPLVISTPTVQSDTNQDPSANMSLLQYETFLVQKELARRQVEKRNANGLKTFITRLGTPIYIGHEISPPRKVEAALSPHPDLLATSSLALMGIMKPVTTSMPEASETSEASETPETSEKKYQITGSITLADGAGVVEGEQQLLIYHDVHGAEAESGKVEMTSGQFVIETDNLKGTVVAEVRSPSGELVARGMTPLEKFRDSYSDQTNSGQTKINHVNILVTPDDIGAEAEVVTSGALGSKKSIIPDATLVVAGINKPIPYLNSWGMFYSSRLIEPSNYLVAANHSGYWPSVAIDRSGEPFQVRLFSNGLIDSFLGLTLPKDEADAAENLGVIWGQVSMQGEPVEGANVEIVGDSAHAPTYFTGFIPDKERMSTSASGEFAYSALNPVVTALRVSLGPKSFWPVLLPIYTHTVTYANLEIEAARAINFHVFDAFTKKSKDALVTPLGTHKEFYVPAQGSHQTNVQTVNGLTLLEAQSGAQYATIRCALEPHQNEVSFPLVRNDWLNYLRQSSGMGSTGLEGTAVAAVFFVKGNDYRAFIGKSDANPYQKIAYFNSSGEFVNQATPDGGFVVFGLPSGFETISLKSNDSNKIVTKLIYADSYAVTVTNVNLGYSY